jgi:ligand-binding sensor protein
MYTTHFDMAFTVMIIIGCSILLGFVLGAVITVHKEQQKVIRYASKNDMNTMHELLRDLYPFVFWEPSFLMRKKEVKND